MQDTWHVFRSIGVGALLKGLWIFWVYSSVVCIFEAQLIANFKKNLSQVALNCLDIYSVRDVLKCLHPSLGLDSERCERLNPARSLVLESGWFLVAFTFPLEYCRIFWWCNVIQTAHYESWYQDDIDCRCRWHDHRIFSVVHDFCFYIFRSRCSFYLQSQKGQVSKSHSIYRCGAVQISFRYHHQELQMMEPTVVLVFLMFKGNIANPLKRSHA